MAWISVTEADVLTVLSGTELEKYRAVALKLGQTDPVEPTIIQVVDEVRGYCPKAATLGDGATIPKKLLGSALALIVVRIPARVSLSAGAVREKLAEEAIKRLERWSDGKFNTEEPETPDTEEPAASGRPSFSGRQRRKPRRR